MKRAFDTERFQRRFAENLAATQARYRAPAKRAPNRLDLGSASERIACRSSALTDLARETGVGQRDTIRRLWILSKCQACGECADMMAR